mmetsp:Transcript_35138/g.110625  ORF Transcript_35138/g.110625 Transcript_35138/m.110625 type:complete len:144 (-) Transcript_35138:231-662(-)
MGFDYASAQDALKLKNLTAETAINFLLNGGLAPQGARDTADGAGGSSLRPPSPEGVADIEEGRSLFRTSDDDKMDIAATGAGSGEGMGLAAGPDEDKLRQLMDMGFPRDACAKALARWETLEGAANELLGMTGPTPAGFGGLD